MILLEAIKTNLPMRRPNYAKDSWIYLDKSKNHSDEDIFVWEESESVKAFGADDILATDWEVKEEQYQLSETQIRNWLEASITARQYRIEDNNGFKINVKTFVFSLLEDFKSQ